MSKVRKNRNGLSRPKRAYEDIPFEVPNVLGNASYGVSSITPPQSRYVQQVLRDKPIVYWRLDDPQGTTLANSATEDKAVTVATAGLTFQTSAGLLSGKGIALNGLQSRGSFSTITLGTTCSFELWFVTPWQAVNPHYALLVGNSAGGSSLYFLMDTFKFDCFTSTDKTNNTTLTANTLYHLVVSISAGNGTFYLNGVPDGTFTGWASRDVDSLFNTSGGSAAPVGIIDEIALYDYALTADQVANHYNLGLRSY